MGITRLSYSITNQTCQLDLLKQALLNGQLLNVYLLRNQRQILDKAPHCVLLPQG